MIIILRSCLRICGGAKTIDCCGFKKKRAQNIRDRVYESLKKDLNKEDLDHFDVNMEEDVILMEERIIARYRRLLEFKF